jgi:hypothetical protein
MSFKTLKNSFIILKEVFVKKPNSFTIYNSVFTLFWNFYLKATVDLLKKHY